MAQLKADIYDTTRKRLLRGREDMLGLVSAQLKYDSTDSARMGRKPIWVDIGGGIVEHRDLIYHNC